MLLRLGDSEVCENECCHAIVLTVGDSNDKVSTQAQEAAESE